MPKIDDGAGTVADDTQARGVVALMKEPTPSRGFDASAELRTRASAGAGEGTFGPALKGRSQQHSKKSVPNRADAMRLGGEFIHVVAS
jgi:hypothetical protein